MNKWLSGIVLGSLLCCCGAAENYDGLMKSGKAALNSKKFDEAIAAFQKAEKITKSPYYKAEAVKSRAKCFADQGKYEDAIALLQTVSAIKDVPPFCVSYADYDSGMYAEKLKKTDDALKYYLHGSKVKQDCDKPIECMLKAGALLTAQKKYQEAIDIYISCNKAKDLNKAVTGYTNASGVYQYYIKDFDKAMQMLAEGEKVADKMKTSDCKLRVIYFRAYLYLKSKKIDEAFNEFLKVKTFEKPQRDWAAALYSGAAVIAYDNKKDVKLAKELMEKSVSYKSSWGTSKHYQKLILGTK